MCMLVREGLSVWWECHVDCIAGVGSTAGYVIGNIANEPISCELSLRLPCQGSFADVAIQRSSSAALHTHLVSCLLLLSVPLMSLCIHLLKRCVQTCGSTSGGHFNPSVTICQVIFRGFPVTKACRCAVRRHPFIGVLTLSSIL